MFCFIIPGMDEMEENIDQVQLKHKEEAHSRMKADAQDRTVLRRKLAICINPLNPAEHPPSCLINIWTGDNILNQEVNVDNALEWGKKQQEEFEAAWPDRFYKPLKQVVVPMTANRKSINVGSQRVVDTGVFCARAPGLHARQRDGILLIELMLATELSPVATSVFDNKGHMRTTQKSHPKTELAVPCSGVLKIGHKGSSWIMYYQITHYYAMECPKVQYWAPYCSQSMCSPSVTSLKNMG